jgi:hypothetical protein
MTRNQIDENTRLAETIDGRWMIIVGGIQWAPPGAVRDRSGAGDATYPSRRAARAAFAASEQALAEADRHFADQAGR